MKSKKSLVKSTVIFVYHCDVMLTGRLTHILSCLVSSHPRSECWSHDESLLPILFYCPRFSGMSELSLASCLSMWCFLTTNLWSSSHVLHAVLQENCGFQNKKIWQLTTPSISKIFWQNFAGCCQIILDYFLQILFKSVEILLSYHARNAQGCNFFSNTL